MKTFLFCIFLVSYSLLNAQETQQTLSEKDSSTYIIRLNDNTSLSGKILERTKSEIIFQDITIGKVTIPLSKIEKMTKLTGEQLCILTTNDGKTFTGLLLYQNDVEATIRTESLGEITIANNKIREIKPIEKEQVVNGRYYFTNPHPTRYFFGPSAIPLKKNEGYYQNAYILANSVQIGVSDNFSMGGGVVIPFLFFITPKVGAKIAEKVYVGGGLLAATTISANMPFGIAVGYGTFTYGTTEHSFSVNAGWGAVKEESYNYMTSSSNTEWKMAKKPMFSVSGMVRVAPKVALITENWFFAGKKYDYNSPYDPVTYEYDFEYKYFSVITMGFRLMGEKNSFDIAVAFPSIDGETLGIPDLDYVFKF